MGNFIHHVTGGSAVGLAVGYVGLSHFQLPLPDAAAAGVACTIASLIPDIDSQGSRPNQLLFQALGALTPVTLVYYFANQLRWSILLLVSIAAYLFVGWGLRFAFAKLTVHRGIFHSIPMAIIAGAAVFLLYAPLPPLERHWMAAAVTIGYTAHLVIDEMFAFVNFEGARLSPKESFGTALKFGTSSPLVTTATYGILFLLLYWCLQSDPLSSRFAVVDLFRSP